MSVMNILDDMIAAFTENYSTEGDFTIVVPEGIYHQMMIENCQPNKEGFTCATLHTQAGTITVKMDPSREIERKKEQIAILEAEISKLKEV